MREFRSKIRAPFRDVSGVISLKQIEKICRIFETIAKILNQKRNFACCTRNFVVWFAKIDYIDRLFRFVNNCGHFSSSLCIHIIYKLYFFFAYVLKILRYMYMKQQQTSQASFLIIHLP